MRLVLTILLLLVGFATFAQTSPKKKKRKSRSEQSQRPTSRDPAYSPMPDFTPREPKKKKHAKGPTYNADEQYADRMNELVKTRRKNERYMMTPQYANPTYFGHKRPPKKRSPDKMKFCKVCGIRH